MISNTFLTLVLKYFQQDVDDVSAQLSWNNRDEMFSGTERPTRYSVDK